MPNWFTGLNQGSAASKINNPNLLKKTILDQIYLEKNIRGTDLIRGGQHSTAGQIRPTKQTFLAIDVLFS